MGKTRSFRRELEVPAHAFLFPSGIQPEVDRKKNVFTLESSDYETFGMCRSPSRRKSDKLFIIAGDHLDTSS